MNLKQFLVVKYLLYLAYILTAWAYEHPALPRPLAPSRLEIRTVLTARGAAIQSD